MSYGCHNREEFKDMTITSTVFDAEGVARKHEEIIPFKMSRMCEYTKTDLGQVDARCIGCKWRE